jgi:hypothetical protein
MTTSIEIQALLNVSRAGQPALFGSTPFRTHGRLVAVRAGGHRGDVLSAQVAYACSGEHGALHSSCSGAGA